MKNYRRKHRRLAQDCHADPMLLDLVNGLDRIACDHNGGYPLCVRCTRTLDRIKLSIIGTDSPALTFAQMEGVYLRLAVRTARFFTNGVVQVDDEKEVFDDLDRYYSAAERELADPRVTVSDRANAIAYLALRAPIHYRSQMWIDGNEDQLKAIADLWYGTPEAHFDAVKWVVSEFRKMMNLVVDDGMEADFSELEAEPRAPLEAPC